MWIKAGLDRYIAITSQGPDTVDDWVTHLRSTPQLDVSEPEHVEIGGASGYALDAAVSSQASETGCRNQGRCYTLFADDGGQWVMVDDRPARLWIIDVDGETLAIVTDAPDGAFESWKSAVTEALSSLQWEN